MKIINISENYIYFYIHMFYNIVGKENISKKGGVGHD
jgi:hypothetical protein